MKCTPPVPSFPLLGRVNPAFDGRESRRSPFQVLWRTAIGGGGHGAGSSRRRCRRRSRRRFGAPRLLRRCRRTTASTPGGGGGSPSIALSPPRLFGLRVLLSAPNGRHVQSVDQSSSAESSSSSSAASRPDLRSRYASWTRYASWPGCATRPPRHHLRHFRNSHHANSGQKENFFSLIWS